jgi:hypothetical protein
MLHGSVSNIRMRAQAALEIVSVRRQGRNQSFNSAGNAAGFLRLAAIAAAAFSILYFFMPETREKNFPNENL